MLTVTCNLCLLECVVICVWYLLGEISAGRHGNADASSTVNEYVISGWYPADACSSYDERAETKQQQ